MRATLKNVLGEVIVDSTGPSEAVADNFSAAVYDMIADLPQTDEINVQDITTWTIEVSH